ncbi:MFS transporter [Streptomyces sp. NPDC046557]|uniref:MFS transporter n=1 Tax=Streptomyces sp. NPDC046557 TaxID=3155372 RepID=UPI0033D8E24F
MPSSTPLVPGPRPAPAAAPLPASAPGPAPSASRSPWRSLRSRSMRWWSVANFVSNAGTWMQLTVQNLLVLQITGSAAATGLSMSVQAAPGLLMGLAGGAAVDRWPRKLTAAVSQALLGAVAFLTAFLVAFDQLNLAVLMVLAATTGIIATVDGPACALLGNDLVPTEDVPSAIGVGSLVHNAGRLAGAALAGVVVGFLGTGAAYAANGVSFLFVVAVIPFLKAARPNGPAAAPRSGSRREEPEEPNERMRGKEGKDAAEGMSAREGLLFFLRRPRLVALAAVSGLSALLGRNYGLTLVVLVTGPLAGDAAAFGTVSTVLAVGGILGAVLGARLRKPTVRLVGVLAAAGALLQVLAGLSPSLTVLLVLVLPMAVAESVSETAGTTVLQTDPPAHMRGRVLGVWSTVKTLWGLAAPPTLGLLMEWAGVRGALVAGGLVVFAVLTSGLLLRGRRATPVVVPATPVVRTPVRSGLEAAA